MLPIRLVMQQPSKPEIAIPEVALPVPVLAMAMAASVDPLAQ